MSETSISKMVRYTLLAFFAGSAAHGAPLQLQLAPGEIAAVTPIAKPRTKPQPTPARSDTPPARTKSAARPAEPETSPLVSAVRTVIPWVAAVGVLLAASKTGATYVDGREEWLLKKPTARDATDTWRNHATPGQRPSAGGPVEPSTLHP